MAQYNQLSDNNFCYTLNWPINCETRQRKRDVNIQIENDDQVQEPTTSANIKLLNPYIRWYFFITGQWFLPVEKYITSANLPRTGCRIAYAIWQVIVVLIMWANFLYSMGFFTLRTIEEVDWLCPLTDIKNMVYGFCWIVNQHTGLAFFLVSNLESLLKRLSITKQEVKNRASSHSITVFMVGSVAWLFIVPLTLHTTQMLMPKWLPVPRYKDDKITVTNNHTFPPTQVALDVIFFTVSRAFSLPIFYAFLYMLLFLCCEVDKFKDDLGEGHYSSEKKAKAKATEIRITIEETEKAFRLFLTLYIALLLIASALEIFSIVEKAETVITGNHTVYAISGTASSVTASSLQTLHVSASENLIAFPHRFTGKRSIPHYLFVIPPPSNHTVGMPGTEHLIPKILVDKYKVKTQEIVVTAVLDITQNVVLYAFPLHRMSVLKSCLKRVLQMVKDSDYEEQDTHSEQRNSGSDRGGESCNSTGQNPNVTIKKIFRTRQEKHDFVEWFGDSCTSGIRVLGKEVSFLWTLVLTFFGPFVVVVVNLMFKHIHIESPWH